MASLSLFDAPPPVDPRPVNTAPWKAYDGVTLYHGDCVDILRAMPANSVDALVTDPPYGIGFMGKEWDTFDPERARASKMFAIGHGANARKDSPNPNLRGRRQTPAMSPSQIEYDQSISAHEAFMRWTISWAREAFRVLKPGAHIVVCGAPRTYHWMACGLEYAGFETRDSLLYWGFGQGLPKSLNVSADERFCQCAQERRQHGAAAVHDLRPTVDANEPVSGDEKSDVLMGVRQSEAARPQTQAGDSERDMRGVSADVPSAAEPSRPGKSCDVLEDLQRPSEGQDAYSVLGQHEGSKTDGPAARCNESCVEGRRHGLSEEGKLQTNHVRALPDSVAADGEERRLRDDPSPRDGGVGWSSTDERRSSASPGSRSTRERPNEFRTMAGQPVTQDGGAWPICDRCGKPSIPPGLGSALKPGYEPIVLARKPFEGTLTSNVEIWGTGALNIDACRLGPGVDVSGGGGSKSDRSMHGGDGHDLGRWPANIVLDEQAASRLDEQAGERISGANPTRRGSDKFRKVFGKFKGEELITPARGAQSGGASRFFFVAKPSRAERDFGCEDLRVLTPSECTERKEGSAGITPYAGAGRSGGGRNFHPTVKPVLLMRWLIRLITPPGGVVLDAFLGSGTTGMAAVLEKRQFIGIDRESKYLTLSDARISAVVREMRLPSADQDSFVTGSRKGTA